MATNSENRITPHGVILETQSTQICIYQASYKYCILITVRIHYTNICRNIVNNNDELQRTNERTHFFIKIYLSHFILERVDVSCVWVGDGDRPLHIDPSSSDHSSTSSSFWLGCSTVGHWEPKTLCLPLALNSASCLQLTPTPADSSRLCLGYIFVSCPPASAVLPLIYTGASLEGQYVTPIYTSLFQSISIHRISIYLSIYLRISCNLSYLLIIF